MKDRNSFDLSGTLVSYELTPKTADNGTEVIYGTVTLKVSKEGAQATTRFYVREYTNAGKYNNSYKVLSNILAGEYRCETDEGPGDWLAISANFNVNYFPGRDGCNDPDDLQRALQIRGFVISPARKHEYVAKWKVDMLITRIKEQEENPEKDTPRQVIVSGYLIDSYNKRVVECDFRAFKEAAINYYVGIAEEASNKEPYYAQIWGGINHMTVKSVLKNNFGDDEVREYARDTFAIEGMADRYEFEDDAHTLSLETYEEFKNGLDEYKSAEFARQVTDVSTGDDNLDF